MNTLSSFGRLSFNRLYITEKRVADEKFINVIKCGRQVFKAFFLAFADAFKLTSKIFTYDITTNNKGKTTKIITKAKPYRSANILLKQERLTIAKLSQNSLFIVYLHKGIREVRYIWVPIRQIGKM
ncbi:hypothetical protein HF521_003069 [Silurus meridionalis]|uniref:Uncharacterized protein n=1 Tax=Silurus meridionalis TaxID=175797 RepID=A0A8T0B348_SILME|nr:hypothetical protein HF521_003069 [Silurus meridionalis]